MNDPLLAYLAQGKDPSHVANLEQEFAARLARMLAASPGGLTINSGYRSPERQAELWEAALAKYGDPEIADNWVARPGKSNHQRGGAVDFGYATPEAKAWAHANAPNFGLHYPMSWEDWHIELADGPRGEFPGEVPASGNPMLPPGVVGPDGLAPPAPPSLASMLATSSGGMGGRPSQGGARAAPQQDLQANLAVPNLNIAALLDQLQAASSRPAQKLGLPQLLG